MGPSLLRKFSQMPVAARLTAGDEQWLSVWQLPWVSLGGLERSQVRKLLHQDCLASLGTSSGHGALPSRAASTAWESPGGSSGFCPAVRIQNKSSSIQCFLGAGPYAEHSIFICSLNHERNPGYNTRACDMKFTQITEKLL